MSRDYRPDELLSQQVWRFDDVDFFGVRVNRKPKLPAAVPLNIPRDRRRRTLGEPIAFHPKNGADILSPRRSLGTVPSNGVASGMAINRANETLSRTIRVGRVEYEMLDENGRKVPEQRLRDIPAGPDDWVHHGGWPERPAWDDRSACWVFEDGRIVSVWGWDPRPGVWPVELSAELQAKLNHAKTWGRFNNRGELVEGSGGSTANGDPWVATTLTPDLVRAGVPVLLSFFAPIYRQFKRPDENGEREQVDGLLENPADDWGLACGDVVIWPEDDPVVVALRKFGPSCDFIADCMTQCGMVANDQAGSSKPVERDADGVVVTEKLEPKAPALRVQACADWASKELADIRNFQFKLSGAVLAVEQHVEFRLPDDPHTPFTPPEPAPDPRLGLLTDAHGAFEDVLWNLGLKSVDAARLANLNDRTLNEAIGLITKEARNG